MAVYALCLRAGTNPSPAILAAALCVGLMRDPRSFTPRIFFTKLLTMPLVAIAAGLVGATLLRFPIAGAVLFCAGVTFSVALRYFGERASGLGRVIALPLLAILIVPVVPTPGVASLTTALLVIAAGAIALGASAIASYPFGSAKIPARPPKASKSTVPLRMAAQMLVALAIAFAAGLIFFPAHWPWIVLSAFIVCSGAIGRGDALYKAILRLGGAIGGTLVAAVLSFVDTSNSELYAALVFFVLFVGVWLRQINYAYWAACATLIFALLQNVQGPGAGALFGIRVLCIFIGALCGVLATWFVYPIRTGQIVRRRIGDALIAMRGVLTGEEHDLEHHAAQLDRIAPPLRLHRTFFARDDSGQHPATLVERTRALLTDLRAPDYDRARVGAEMKRLRSSLENKET